MKFLRLPSVLYAEVDRKTGKCKVFTYKEHWQARRAASARRADPSDVNHDNEPMYMEGEVRWVQR